MNQSRTNTHHFSIIDIGGHCYFETIKIKFEARYSGTQNYEVRTGELKPLFYKDYIGLSCIPHKSGKCYS